MHYTPYSPAWGVLTITYVCVYTYSRYSYAGSRGILSIAGNVGNASNRGKVSNAGDRGKVGS